MTDGRIAALEKRVEDLFDLVKTLDQAMRTSHELTAQNAELLQVNGELLIRKNHLELLLIEKGVISSVDIDDIERRVSEEAERVAEVIPFPE